MRKSCADAVWFVYSIVMSWNVASASLLVSVGEFAEAMMMLVSALSRNPKVSDSLVVLRWLPLTHADSWWTSPRTDDSSGLDLVHVGRAQRSATASACALAA